MKKQVKNPIFKSVLLLLSVILVLTGAVIAVVAATTNSASLCKTLTITLDNNVEECIVEYTKASTGEVVKEIVQSGDVIEILNGVTVTVTVKPYDGKWPYFTVGDEENPGSAWGSILTWKEFTADNTVSVVCENRIYTIHALNYDRVDGEYEYSLKSGENVWTIDELTNNSAKYQSGSNPLRQFPAASMGSWTFEGWYIVTSDSEGGSLLMEKDEVTGNYYIPKELPMTTYMYAQDGFIYVYPKFTAPLYDIYRQDWVYYGGSESKHMFTYMMQEEAQREYSAIQSGYWQDDKNVGGYVSYPGYILVTHLCTEYCGKDICKAYGTKTVLNSNGAGLEFRNTVKRYYAPIVYNLTFVDVPSGFGTPKKYVYGIGTKDEVGKEMSIGNPTRPGYNFLGWLVELYDPETDTWYNPHERGEKKIVDPSFALGDKNAYYDVDTKTWKDANVTYAAKARADGTGDIRLTAQWQPITYILDYEWGEGVDNELETQLNNTNTLPGSFVFDSGVLEIINPKRPGYTFTGWIRNYVDGEGNPQQEALSHADGKTMLDCSAYAHDITLTATWQAKTFDVVFGDVDGITNGGEYTNGIAGVVYDQPLTIPQGFIIPTKTGYTFAGYYAADGVTKYINADGTSNCNKWDIDSDSDTVTLYAKWEANPCNITVTIDGLPTDATVTIKVITAGGTSKTVANGETIILPYDTVFHVEITELGKFRVVQFSSNGTNVTFSGEEAFVSNDITVDAEAVVLTAVVWPASPERDRDVVVSPTEKDTELKVTFKEHINASDYEVAISQKDDLTNEQIEALDWYQIAEGTNSYLFENLEAGTYYSVFIRVKATDQTYSGIILKVRVFTEYNEHIESAKNDLASKLTNDDVTNCYANKVIEDALEEIRKKEAEWRENGSLPVDFQAQIDKLVNDAKAAFEVAQVKDSKLVEWRDLYFAYEASGSFDETRKVELLDISDRAEEAIRNATTKDDINKAFNDAKAEIEKVPVTYLYDTNKVMQLESLLGLGQTSGITLTSIEDIRALRRAIADAIAQGNITADSFITIEEATNLLRALDVVSAYSFNLINVQMSEGDVFTLRMTIPESLINCTGLQVAYFNQATGVLELLETKQEGNTLVFKAKQITDFVILADPTVDLTAVIIALGAILLCQLIAIAFVLISRNKAKNSVMHASVALPLFLTIHFLPVANAELIALGLGAAVLLAQIVLMWLLLSSGMIRVFKTKKTAPQKKEVTAVVREEDLHEDPYAAFDEELSNEEPVEESVEEDLVEEETVTEESPKEEPEEEVLDEDAFDEELAEELAREQDEVAEAEEVYDDEEFIEHAPNPYYSLDEEENEYAFDEEEAERVSDVDTTDQEAEETSFGDDPVDGVFGETDVQYGDTGDEGGRSSDEDSYAESYEYGDEADASYAETEVADREETSSEGSVDPASYIVNDDEDLSNEEEMYRYDE